ncbi:MAG: glycosyltransferase family 2 protein [Litorimonas sp.]
MTRRMNPSRVCVSVPIGYRSKFLRSALGSLKAQNEYLDVAILDASGDPDVNHHILESGVQTTYHRCAPDGGQSDAIAEGWASSTAPILAWLNADDMLVENCIPTVLAAFDANPSIDLIYGHSTICNDDGVVLGLHSAVRPVSDILYRDNYISQPSCFIRRRALDEIGGIDKNLHFTMDWDLWLRLYDSGHQFLFLDKIFSNVSWAADTKTSQISWKRYREFAAILRRSQGFISVVKGVVSSMRQTRGVYRDQTKWEESLMPLYDGKTSAIVPIINATESVKDTLICKFSRAVEGYDVSSDEGNIEHAGAVLTLNLDIPLKPGQCARIRIKPQNPVDIVTLLEVRWA